MTSLSFLSKIQPQGYLKLVKGELLDTFPLKLVDLATGETKRFFNYKDRAELKELRIAVREFNKRKETV